MGPAGQRRLLAAAPFTFTFTFTFTLTLPSAAMLKYFYTSS